MLFKVTHIDPAGHCRKARVSATSNGDAFDQMDRQFGEGTGGAAMRMSATPVLHVVLTAKPMPKPAAKVLATTTMAYGLEAAA